MVINFWATWCVPCVRELPALQRFAREHAASGWKVIALAVDQPVPVLEFIARFKLDIPVALAGVDGMEWQRTVGNTAGGLPFSVVLDAHGRVRQRRLGESHYDELVTVGGRGDVLKRLLFGLPVRLIALFRPNGLELPRNRLESGPAPPLEHAPRARRLRRGQCPSGRALRLCLSKLDGR